MEKSQEYYKRELLSDISNILAILGGNQELVNLVRNYAEMPLNEEFILTIKRHSMTELDTLKTRFTLLDTISVKVG